MRVNFNELNPVEESIIQKNNWKRKFFHFKDVYLHAVIADKASKNAPIIILLHGFPEFWFSWRYIMPELSKKFHVVALDQRGFNLSGKPYLVKYYGQNYLASDPVRVLRKEAYNYYHIECGLPRNDKRITNPKAVFIGHDWGGGIAWNIARWYPNNVEKLIILNCPPVEILLNEVSTNIRQLLSSYYIFMFQIPFLGERFLFQFKEKLFKGIAQKNYYGEGEKDISAYIKAYSYKRATSGINYYRAAMRWGLLGRFNNPERISCPTHVIWGTADQALTTDLTHKFPANVEKGKYTITYLPGISHWIQQEAPKEVSKEILNFTIDNRDRV
ncbi:MAG: alpha/beta fold hydrolase [Candidatus Lokiarchaeota archaeon]|nr:alpha/beta fold hydrolase [Candidatus Lokiarchaeota archaeon]